MTPKTPEYPINPPTMAPHTVAVTLTPECLIRLEAWMTKRQVRSRADAIRQLVENALWE
jgi:hypothetical protein